MAVILLNTAFGRIRRMEAFVISRACSAGRSHLAPERQFKMTLCRDQAHAVILLIQPGVSNRVFQLADGPSLLEQAHDARLERQLTAQSSGVGAGAAAAAVQRYHARQGAQGLGSGSGRVRHRVCPRAGQCVEHYCRSCQGAQTQS